jgi:hypothetical protein
VKRIFTALAIVAIVNVVALGGLAAYARVQHWLTKDRVRRAVAVLKGDEKKPVEPTLTPAATKPEGIAKNAGPSELDEGVVRTEFERREREIQDGWQLLETRQLALVKQREELDEDRGRLAKEQELKALKAGNNGAQKELDILGGIKPKQAKELLQQKRDADVVAILKTLEDRKVRKIVGECKTAEERLWIGRILEQLHDGRATQAEVLNAGT